MNPPRPLASERVDPKHISLTSKLTLPLPPPIASSRLVVPRVKWLVTLLGNPLPLIFNDFDWFSTVFHWFSLIGSSSPSLRITFWHSQAPQSIKFNIFSLILRNFQWFSLISTGFSLFSTLFIGFHRFWIDFWPVLTTSQWFDIGSTVSNAPNT